MTRCGGTESEVSDLVDSIDERVVGNSSCSLEVLLLWVDVRRFRNGYGGGTAV